VFGTVDVTLDPGSRVGRAVGPATVVRCHHHQSLDVLGDGLVVTARAADGTVEAVERPGPTFVVGVQWHPEQSTSDVRLVTALVAATVQTSV
jgi:gamma-glutamyl-gamma-aminobutyrate hydrolase PuuD